MLASGEHALGYDWTILIIDRLAQSEPITFDPAKSRPLKD